MSNDKSNPDKDSQAKSGDGGAASPELVKSTFWFGCFALSSVSMVLLNKYCAASFDQPYSLLGFQNSMTILLNIIFVKAGVFKVQAFTGAQFRMFIIPTFLFVGMLITSLKGLPYVSIATTVIFRAISTCLVAIGDFFFFKKSFLPAEYICLVVVVIGALIYAAGDLSYDPTGYYWMACNTVMFVSSQLYEKYAICSLDQTPVGISCVQNLLSLPILLVFGAFVAQETPVTKLQGLGTFTYVALFLTGIAGCGLSLCYMNLSKFASATSISLSGNANKLLSIVVGAAVFNNPLSIQQLFGLFLSMGATMAFSQKGNLPVLKSKAAMATLSSVLVLFSVLRVSLVEIPDGDIGSRFGRRGKGKATASAETGMVQFLRVQEQMRARLQAQDSLAATVMMTGLRLKDLNSEKQKRIESILASELDLDEGAVKLTALTSAKDPFFPLFLDPQIREAATNPNAARPESLPEVSTKQLKLRSESRRQVDSLSAGSTKSPNSASEENDGAGRLKHAEKHAHEQKKPQEQEDKEQGEAEDVVILGRSQDR